MSLGSSDLLVCEGVVEFSSLADGAGAGDGLLRRVLSAAASLRRRRKRYQVLGINCL